MKRSIILLLSATAMLASCKESPKQSNNPLLSDFTTPYQTPPFDQIKKSDYKPAMIEAMAQQKAEIEAIINNPEEATFENTIVSFDRSGKRLNSITAIFSNLYSADTDDEMQVLAEELMPMLSAHSDEISMNPKLFERIKSLYDKKDQLGLDPLALLTLERYYNDLVRDGANLSPEDKDKLKKINSELSTLTLKFGDNLLKETNNFKLVLEDEKDLAGLPENVIAAAAAEAKNAGMEGKWVFTLNKPSWIPFLTYSTRPDLRAKLYAGYYMRADNNNENDNKALVNQIINLRQQRAQLLGFDTYSNYVIDENMAKTSQNVMDFLGRVWTPALKVANQELADMQKIADKEQPGYKLTAADWWYYAEKLRKEKYDLDESEIQPYLAMTNVRDGMFHVANKLYGVTMHKRTDIPVYHADVETFEMKDADGTSLGIFYLDPYTRPSKSNGAWCTGFRSYDKENGQETMPLVSVVCNFPKPVGENPSLLSWDDAETMFHEFGHALHGFFTRGDYHRIAGTVPNDMVELPSQIMENWAAEPEVLKVYAKNYKTGEPMPDALIAKLQNSRHFNQGFATVENIAACLLDMSLYNQKEPMTTDVDTFEQGVMEQYGLIKEILPRYRTTYFSHIIDGGYSAGYYVYLWAAVLDSDAFKAFKESGDIYNPELAAKFRKYVLSEGGFGDPMGQYISFRGGAPSEAPLLEKRGFN